MKMQIGLYAIALMVLCGCRLSDEEIKRDWWKYRSGYSIGDQLRNLDEQLINDTIYQSGEPVATIYSTAKGFFGSGDEIVIQDLKSDELGYYHFKGN